MRYILTVHTGKGFYTHEDRINMDVFKFFDGLATIDGNCDEWIERVKGKEISETEASIMLKQKFDVNKIVKVAEKTKKLKELKDKTYDFADF